MAHRRTASFTARRTTRPNNARAITLLRWSLLAIITALVFLLPQSIDMQLPIADSISLRRPADVTVQVDRAKRAGRSQMAVGATHVQYSLDSWGDQAAITRGKALLENVAVYQNQHIMGFGAPNPEPRKGEFDWSGLDRRVQLMRDTNAIPTITLCCAPDWMKGGKAGSTDWSTLEDAPLPKHYDDFAELARQVAERYPDVKHYFVWNEMKGFWHPDTNNWDYVAYTKLYNKVYDALKSVNPNIQVGGPYIVIEGTGTGGSDWWAQRPIGDRNRAAIQYWLDHKRGADFLVVDRAVKGPQDTNDYSHAQYLALTPLFSDITQQLRAMTNLPIWWAESYFTRDDQQRDFEAAGLASMLYHQLQAGSAVSLRWAPQAQPDGAVGQNLFTDTQQPEGGQPLPPYAVYQAFHDHFGPGTQLYAASSSSSDVEVLASASKVLVINKRPSPITVDVNTVRVELKGYAVRVVSL